MDFERVDARRLDSEERLKSKDVKIYDVMLLEGLPYRRLADATTARCGPAMRRKSRRNSQGISPIAGKRPQRSGRFAGLPRESS